MDDQTVAGFFRMQSSRIRYSLETGVAWKWQWVLALTHINYIYIHLLEAWNST